MSNSIVLNRYAKTLFELSVESNSLDSVYNDMYNLQNIFEDELNLSSFISNKLLSPDKKSELFNSLSGVFQPLTIKFIQFLQTKRRLDILSEIPKFFFRLYEKQKNIVNAEIISAFRLSDIQIEKIKAKIKTRHNASEILISHKIDPSLLAGMQIIIGDKVFDANIKQKLSKLKMQISK